MKLDLGDNELVNALSRKGRDCLFGNLRSVLDPSLSVRRFLKDSVCSLIR